MAGSQAAALNRGDLLIQVKRRASRAASIVSRMRRLTKRERAALIAVPVIAAGVVAQLFWNFNWSTFLPDLIVGGFTGLAVGFVLWRVDLANQDRGQRSRVAADWDVTQREVARAVEQDYVYKPNSLELTGYGVDSIRRSTKGLPLHSWAKELDSDTIRCLIAYLTAADEFDHAARALDTQFNSVSYLYSADRSTINPTATKAARSHADPYRARQILPDDDDTDELWTILRDEEAAFRMLEFRAALFGLESAWYDLAASVAAVEEARALNDA